MTLKAALSIPVILILSILVSCTRAKEPLEIYTTGGHTLYHVKPATVKKRSRAVIGAAYDGSVLCYTPEGKLIWKTGIGEAFPFDVCVDDINADGLDEILIAASDGVLYAIGPDGNHLWSFKKMLPLYQVCTAKMDDGTRIIFAGGVDDTLYSLSPEGELRGKLLVESHITRVRSGDILGQGRDLVAVASTTNALAGTLSMSLVDPVDMRLVWSHTKIGSYAPNSGRRFFSMVILDLNNDQKEDILVSGSWGQHGKIFAYDQAGELMFEKSDLRIPNVPYRMNILVPVKLPTDEYIIGQFGNIIIVYNMDGSCREVVTGPFSYANASFDPLTNILYCGSSVSGGDELVMIHLDQPGWQKAFEEAKPVGKLAQIIANMEELTQQVEAFERPEYQPEPRPADIILQDEYHLRTPEELRERYENGKYTRYISHLVLCQKPEPGALWCRDISAFGEYDMSADEVVEAAKQWEVKGQDFVVQAGHTTALHMSPETFERVLQAAPNHLWGFEFSEIGQKLDEKEQEIVENVMLTLAKQCRKYGNKKILLRTKNIFWNGNIYHPFWENVLLDGQYSDLFIPGLEETNSRTQELSLAGRLGLWQSGVYDHWASRAESDNPCFNRSWEWSSQQVLSHNIRNLVSNASMGSDVFFNGVFQGPFSPELEKQLWPFYEMLEKGVIHIPGRSELVSLSPVALGMKSPPSPDFLGHGTNHAARIYQGEQPPLVFDRMDWYWGAVPLADHDFSKYVFGVKRRMTNFLPLTPYGMVTILPDKQMAGLEKPYEQKITTDGRYFYDENGNAFEPSEYRPQVEKILKEAAKKLPVILEGEANWAIVKMDEDHFRVTLVDPGFLDPADRDVKIILQHGGWKRCTDVLGKEDLTIQDGKVSIRIPMGSVRIVDLIK